MPQWFEQFITISFWTCVSLTIYTYCLYPMGLKISHAILNKRTNRQRFKHVHFPTVTMNIAVCNEEASTLQKFKNGITLDNPKDKMQILSRSNDVHDDTDNLFTQVNHAQFRNTYQLESNGETNILKAVVNLAFISHQFIRWMFPFMMIIMIVSAIALAYQSPIFIIMLQAQCLFYALVITCALIAKVIKILKVLKPLTTCQHFILLNVAILIGFYKFAIVNPKKNWANSKR